MFSRSGSKFDLPQKVIDDMPSDLFLDGELWYCILRHSFSYSSSLLLGLGGTTFKNQWRLHTGWIMIKSIGIHSDSWCLIFPHPKEPILNDIVNYVPNYLTTHLCLINVCLQAMHWGGRSITLLKSRHMHYVKEQIILRRYFRISWIKEEKESSWGILQLLFNQVDQVDSSNTRYASSMKLSFPLRHNYFRNTETLKRKL